VVGNPWTFPLIFWWTYEGGNAMMGAFGGGELPGELTVSFLLHHPWRVLFPMFLGSVPTAIVVWAISFWLVRMAVRGYRRARRHRLERAREQLVAEGADRRG